MGFSLQVAFPRCHVMFGFFREASSERLLRQSGRLADERGHASIRHQKGNLQSTTGLRSRYYGRCVWGYPPCQMQRPRTDSSRADVVFVSSARGAQSAPLPAALAASRQSWRNTPLIWALLCVDDSCQIEWRRRRDQVTPRLTLWSKQAVLGFQKRALWGTTSQKHPD
ncbi:hypothetical protein H257_06669 [Aphanomyces astaci]|uniref:Uncharacterized protein n=1 Tax=Aphanomyces astaci TaxID=112090 RepID=W4GN89_APHAT|nr:hypothetical protein H257_06669 [Aphanomyces astaci]ETV80363.1 hypothetical protein H257_06669 [Aphanomyces astaci]|eukprot:XP_009830287.1 hypothetical protein H257_06669 [Aphanomyces astaci]